MTFIFINTKKKIIPLLFFFFSHTCVFSQETFQEEQFFNNLYSLKLSSSAHQLNQSTNKTEIQSIMLAKAYYFSFLADIEDNKNINDSAVFYSKAIIQKITKKNKVIDIDNFEIIAAQAVLLKFDLNEGNYLSAFINFLKTDEYLEYILKNSLKNDKFKFTSGLYYYYAWLSRKDYPALYPILMFYPSGNREKGLRYLSETAFSKNIFVRTESRYFLARIYRRDEKNFQEANKYFSMLLNDFPGNLSWRYEYAETLKYFGKSNEMLIQKSIFYDYLQNNKELNISQKNFLKKMIINL